MNVGKDTHQKKKKTNVNIAVNLVMCVSAVKNVKWHIFPIIQIEAMTDIEKHEKAIRVLQAIDTTTNRIFRKESDLKKYGENDILGWAKWEAKKIESLKKVKEKLINYYNKNFKI